MTNVHNQSFFGQSTGIIVSSSSKNTPHIFIRCIRKKSDGIWEKPSLGEGKAVKFSLEEIIMMLQVLERKSQSWSTYHSFNDAKTPISFEWSENKLKINIGDYLKVLNFAQSKILQLLMTHILKEKIKYATTTNISEEPKYKDKISKKNKTNKTTVKESIEIGDVEINPEKIDLEGTQFSMREKRKITGSIKAETKKALFILFSSGQEAWIPKSTIRSDYISEFGVNQDFVIEDWILKRNKIKTSD